MVESRLARWWKPESPDQNLPGTLSNEGSQGGVRLLLDGHFDEPKAENAVSGTPVEIKLGFDDIAVLLGITAEGQFLSLIDCRVISSSGLPGLTKSFQVLRPMMIAYDVHFASKNEFQLLSLAARYSNLDKWVDTSGIVLSFAPQTHYSVSINYSKPDSLSATLSNGLSCEISFSVEGPDSASRSEIHVQQKAWLRVYSSEERPYEELLRVLTRIADFVSLGVGQAIRLIEIRASATNSENPGKSIDFRLVDNSEPIAPLREDLDTAQMLFTLNEIRNNFSEILERWCVQRDEITSLYSLYFGTLRSPGMYVEHRFLNQFQALESFDRRTFEPTPEKKAKHQERLERILDDTQGKKDRAWLKGKLRYSQEPSATERLNRLVTQYDAQWIFDQPAHGIELAGNFRNYYTHYDPKLAAKLPSLSLHPPVMHNLAVRLQLLCEIILLREVGFQGDTLKQRMEQTRRLERRLVYPKTALGD